VWFFYLVSKKNRDFAILYPNQFEPSLPSLLGLCFLESLVCIMIWLLVIVIASSFVEIYLGKQRRESKFSFGNLSVKGIVQRKQILTLLLYFNSSVHLQPGCRIYSTRVKKERNESYFV
jgi:hypothetical protein